MASRGESSEGRVISCRGWGAVASRGESPGGGGLKEISRLWPLAHVLLEAAVLHGVTRSHTPFGYGHGTAQRREGVG